MTKATHKGTCQVCGCHQKLPGSNLSKHGYTTRWGFFEGTCHGAHEQPFELSKDLIEEAIDRALIQGTRLLETAVATENQTDKVWVHEYRKAEWGCNGRTIHSRKVWREFDLADVEFVTEYGTKIVYQGENNHGDPVTRRDQISNYSGDNLTDVQALNHQRAKAFRREAEQVAKYVEWQRDRIKGWTPQPDKLIPVK